MSIISGRVSLCLALLLVACTARVTDSPLPTATLQSVPRGYLPLVVRNYAQRSYGIGGADPWGLLHVDWYYTWSVSPAVTNPRFVRMVWCLDDLHLSLYEPQVIRAADADRAAGRAGRWLIGNEPENRAAVTDINAQCGAFSITGSPYDATNLALKVWQAPEEFAVRFSRMYDLIKEHDPQARIFAGGLAQLSDSYTRQWWIRFIAELTRRGELYKVMGVHVHAYPRWSTGPCAGWCMPELLTTLETWYRDYHVGQGLGGRPLWITEIGAGPFCQQYAPFDPGAWTAVRDNVLLPFQQWFESPQNPGYGSAAWFVTWWAGDVGAAWSCNFLVDARSLPVRRTPLGEQYGVSNWQD